MPPEPAAVVDRYGQKVAGYDSDLLHEIPAGGLLSVKAGPGKRLDPLDGPAVLLDDAPALFINGQQKG